MISPDSKLYEAHPDWAIQIPGRKPVKGRNQLLLDFSRKEVVDAVIEIVRRDALPEGGYKYGCRFIGMTDTDALKIDIYQIRQSILLMKLGL